MDLAAILDKVSKKGKSASSPAVEVEAEDEDPSMVAAEAQVEKFFTKGKAGDFGAATSALAAAVRLLSSKGADDEGDED